MFNRELAAYPYNNNDNNIRYEQRIQQFKINKLFQQDQQKIYQQLNGKTGKYEKPDAKDRKEFWSNIRNGEA